MLGSPASFSSPARRTSSRAASRRTIMSAIISWTSWKLGDRHAELLALLRVGDRGVDAALADAHAAGGDRVAARVERRHRDLEPVADLAHQGVVAAPRRRRGRARRCRRRAGQACREPPGVEKPSVSVGTRKHAMPRCPWPGSVWANTSATSATLPSEIHIFCPLIRQPPSIFSARGADRGRVGARVGLGQPEAAEAPRRSRASAASAASAPRCPSARSSRTPARSGRRRRCACAESPRPTSSTISP